MSGQGGKGAGGEGAGRLRDLERARHRSQRHLARRAAQLERLLEISRRVATLDLDDALELILDHLMELTGTRRGAVVLQGEDGCFRFLHRVAIAGRHLAGPGFDVSRSVIRRACLEGHVTCVTDTRRSSFASQPSVMGLGLRAMLAIPLAFGEQVLGALYVDATDDAHQLDEVDPEILAAFGAQAAVTLHHADRYTNLVEDHSRLQRTATDPLRFGDLIYRSTAMHRVRRLLDRVVESDVPVLILGESGTGKELVARALHRLGPRRDRPFVSQNVGAVQDSLLGSELFGHRKGAYSGATWDKPGLFETGNGGTVFLDEIGEASPAFQVALLRLLETGAFRRLGETDERSTDVRIVAATHRDLEEAIARGDFRSDLFYRLEVFPVRLPALRERPEDIPVLVTHFLEAANREFGKNVGAIPQETLAAFQARPWKGNVRELQNLVRRLVLLSESRDLAPPDDLALATSAELDEPEHLGEAGTPLSTLAEVERQHIQRALKQTGGNQSQAARLLGLKRGTLRGRMRKLGL